MAEEGFQSRIRWCNIGYTLGAEKLPDDPMPTYVPQNASLSPIVPRALLLMACLPMLCAAEIVTRQDEQTGLRTWEWRQEGISLQLVQRLPIQTRGFFQGRGFPPAAADTIARACVFQTIFRNDGKRPMTYNLSTWIVRHKNNDLTMQTRETWKPHWESSSVSKAARIAFNWSLLPTRQGFEVGDYNWGMTSFGLPPGASFDLLLSVEVDGRRIRATLPGIQCPTDQADG